MFLGMGFCRGKSAYIDVLEGCTSDMGVTNQTSAENSKAFHEVSPEGAVFASVYERNHCLLEIFYSEDQNIYSMVKADRTLNFVGSQSERFRFKEVLIRIFKLIISYNKSFHQTSACVTGYNRGSFDPESPNTLPMSSMYGIFTCHPHGSGTLSRKLIFWDLPQVRRSGNRGTRQTQKGTLQGLVMSIHELFG